MSDRDRVSGSVLELGEEGASCRPCIRGACFLRNWIWCIPATSLHQSPQVGPSKPEFTQLQFISG